MLALFIFSLRAESALITTSIKLSIFKNPLKSISHCSNNSIAKSLSKVYPLIASSIFNKDPLEIKK